MKGNIGNRKRNKSNETKRNEIRRDEPNQTKPYTTEGESRLLSRYVPHAYQHGTTYIWGRTTHLFLPFAFPSPMSAVPALLITDLQNATIAINQESPRASRTKTSRILLTRDHEFSEANPSSCSGLHNPKSVIHAQRTPEVFPEETSSIALLKFQEHSDHNRGLISERYRPTRSWRIAQTILQTLRSMGDDRALLLTRNPTRLPVKNVLQWLSP